MTISIINKINSINHISKKAKSVLSLLVLMEFCGCHQEMVVSDCYSYFVWFQQAQTKHFLLIVKMKIHFELAQAILWAHSFHALVFSRWMLNVFSYDRIREPKLFCIKNKELIIVKVSQQYMGKQKILFIDSQTIFFTISQGFPLPPPLRVYIACKTIDKILLFN